MAIWLRGRRHAVVEIQETWRVDDEWWRAQPISRRYARCRLGDGRTMTLFEDRVRGGWWLQRA